MRIGGHGGDMEAAAGVYSCIVLTITSNGFHDDTGNDLIKVAIVQSSISPKASNTGTNNGPHVLYRVSQSPSLFPPVLPSCRSLSLPQSFNTFHLRVVSAMIILHHEWFCCVDHEFPSVDG